MVKLNNIQIPFKNLPSCLVCRILSEFRQVHLALIGLQSLPYRMITSGAYEVMGRDKDAKMVDVAFDYKALSSLCTLIKSLLCQKSSTCKCQWHQNWVKSHEVPLKTSMTYNHNSGRSYSCELRIICILCAALQRGYSKFFNLERSGVCLLRSGVQVYVGAEVYASLLLDAFLRQSHLT